MVEEKKQKPPILDAVRPAEISVGEMLRAAREAKKLEIEDVSSSIHVRPAQLRAIEDNNIDALPGMTYAVGFVRSYAVFLGLDGVDIVHKFKAEHGNVASVKLSFPEPEAESRMPDPMMVGVAAFLAILVFVLWTIYSNVYNGDVKLAEQIPPPPAATTTSGIPTDEKIVSVMPVAAVLIPSPQLSPPSVAVVEKQPDVKPLITKPPEITKLPEITKTPKITKTTEIKESLPKSSVINVRRGASRIVLRSVQASWIQVTDARKKVLFMRVLRPGEQYFVPDQPGLSLVTANAGGLEIEVDGKIVQELGKPGEIVRGIVLDPKSLKKRRIRVQN
ncbi:MAG: helix-turn-helix domain-containing protein [Alphaproteobacteria bacterium]|nr:helix-turn-helix domain-containing protein [Alphaproteobacteria bacterium]MCK5658313.1 helix-turn-helix domain-containing protein [Alphaproteobacteria bacterium]